MRADVVAWKRALRDLRGELTATEHHIAVTLTLWMARDGGFNGNPPSQQTVADVAGYHVNTVHHGLAQLEAKGWLQRLSRPGRPSLMYAATPDWVTVDPFAAFGDDPNPHSGEWGSPSNLHSQNVEVTSTSRSRSANNPHSQNVEVASAQLAPPQFEPRTSTVRLWTKSYEVPITTLTESGTTPANGHHERQVEMLRPEDAPHLWDQARTIAQQTPGVRDMQRYALTIFRRLVDQAQATERNATTVAAIEACPHCNTAGLRLIETDGREVAIRCPH